SAPTVCASEATGSSPSLPRPAPRSSWREGPWRDRPPELGPAAETAGTARGQSSAPRTAPASPARFSWATASPAAAPAGGRAGLQAREVPLGWGAGGGTRARPSHHLGAGARGEGGPGPTSFAPARAKTL